MQNQIKIIKPQYKEAVIIPMCGGFVQAGFPSPAEDYLEDSLDLNEHLIANKDSTFFVRVAGESMLDAGIRPNDILIVDKSLRAKNGSIVIAVVDNEFTVKTLVIEDAKITLRAENKDFPDLTLIGTHELIVWGVVTSVIHQYV